MFFKRTLLLVFGVLLFIAGFIFYFDFYVNSQMEYNFRQERKANGVDTGTLTTPIASSSAPSSLAPATAAPDAGMSGATPPASTPDTTPPPAPAPAAPDVIIGPLPPSSAPDSTPAPAPSAPTSSDTNSGAPMAPPSSTMLYPGAKNLALFMLAAYTPTPLGGIRVQTEPSSPLTISTPAPITTPTTNTPAAPPANVPASTNAAPTSITTNAVPAATVPGTTRPVPVEASVIVLLYHQFVAPGVHIPPKLQWTMNQDVFETEMKYIHDNGYHVVPMSDLLKFLKHQIGLPPNSVVITIDDGFKSAIVYAAPILKKYGYPWTFFVYPDFITKTESKGAASWPDLLALQADGVDIECHSMTHPILTKHHQLIKGVWHNFTPAEYDQWLTNETLGAKTLLEQKMGKPITCYAYPYGEYNKEVEAKVIAAGFEAIFTVADNPVRSTTSMDSIGRYTITQSVIKDFYAYLRQGALGLADADPQPGATITNPRPVITAVLSYAGTIDPKSIETEVRDFGPVHHDYDPKTSTIRLYLPRDLIQSVNLVNIRARDAQTGQIMVANWHFNYEAPVPPAIHPPLGALSPGTKNSPAATTNAPHASAPSTNAAPAISSSATVSTTAGVPATNQTDPPKAPLGTP